ncbi:MAG: hypothetical protein KGR18_12340, partial [Acidobacteria bacterium]|nr:hypothetical protein [Acidobacteriota bacterium]
MSVLIPTVCRPQGSAVGVGRVLLDGSRSDRFRLSNGPNDPLALSHPIRTLEHMFEASTAPEPASSVTEPRLCSGSFEALFDQLSGLVAALAECGVPADSSALVGLRAQIDRLSSMVAEAEIRFDQAELWRDAGSGSLRGWMADHCGLGRRAATAEARRVERLEQWPAVVQAWIDARLSAAQVDVIIGAVPRRFVALFADHAESVVDIIGSLDVTNTEVAIRQWVRCAENADGPEQFREPASGLHLDRLLDGRFVLNGQFDSAQAAIIDAALRDFDVPDPVDADGRPIGETRSLAQRNADELLEVCRFAVAHRQGAG